MRLDDDVEATGAHEAVGSREGVVHSAHYFCDADGGRAGDADAAVDEGCCVIGFAAVWRVSMGMGVVGGATNQ